MTNLKCTIKGNILTMEVDLSQEFGLSKSGKNTIIATTSGNADLEGVEGVKIGLNIYKPVD